MMSDDHYGKWTSRSGKASWKLEVLRSVNDAIPKFTDIFDEETFYFTAFLVVVSSERTIPLFISRQDVFVQAPTGSGKTLAFVLPLLEILLRREEKWGKFEVGAIVVVPNRELGLQIHDVLAPFLEALPFLRQVVFCGKRKITVDVTEFRNEGGNIVIGTPGRLETLLEASSEEFSLLNYVKSLDVLILDEADRLLERGFSKSMDKILSTLTKQRRTGLFSATLTDQVEEVIKVGLRNPVKVIIDTEDHVLVPSEVDASSRMRKMPTSIKNYYAVSVCICLCGRGTDIERIISSHASSLRNDK
ncbi:unnamed protein product [Soboliphyme baturini]|uniref:ATP-dependent RNA helicase n=1 Tax=Soboliphyme baturini TaxID=241478 RepID=A0A183IXR4_9BILA|nr:unnamed protein product [Soboliphyme baturini]